MGLAYKLDVELWKGIGDYLSRMIIDLANTDPFTLGTPELGMPSVVWIGHIDFVELRH